MSVATLLASTDVRSITMLGGACVLGFLAAQPSPATVRVVFVALATLGISTLLLRQHDAMDDGRMADEATAARLFSPDPSRRGGTEPTKHGRTVHDPPFATLMHPEATDAIASLAPLSRPGRRAAVRAVATATEGVVQAYHALLVLAVTSAPSRATACIDDLRDRTIVALDALQGLRMSTGSRGPASRLASAAERDLRALFRRFRQIAANRLRRPDLLEGPAPLDPNDDNRFVR